ncbi:MAG: hypothetical protein K1X88_12620 [Nannocystaceae bacterium]|nr:hypothetical protein [Nannocystaceae bacterium]
MLALDRPLGVVGELALFGDHADPSRVYWAATRPQLARDGGVAELSFVKFRDADASGGVGLLSFTTAVVADEAALQAARRHCQHNGIAEPVLVEVPWRAGKAVLAAALKVGDGFVERMLGETTPDLVAGNRAVFSLALTSEGAALVEALLQADATQPSPIGVRYELEFVGLRPALQVRIVADYKRIYDELSWGFQVGVAYEGVGVRAGVESATKKLVEQGAIAIEVMRFSDEADLQRRIDESVKWFQEKIVSDFFKSHMQPPSRGNVLERAIQAAAALGTTLAGALADASLVAQLAQQLGIPVDALRALGQATGGGAGGQGGGAGAASSGETTFALNLQFSFKDIHEQELITVELDWNEAHPERRIAAPQGLLSTFGATPRVIEASDAGSFWQRLDVDVRPLGDFAALGVQRLVTQLAYPDEQQPVSQAALVFEAGDATPQHFAAWTDGKPPRYRVRSEVHFVEGGAWTGAPQFVGEWHDATALQLAVHPLSDVPRLEIEIVPGTVSFDDTPQVQIDTRVDGVADRSLMLTKAEPRASFRRRLAPLPPPEPAPPPETGPFAAPPAAPPPPKPRLEVRTTWFFTDGPSESSAWEPVEGNTVVVRAPWRSQRTLRLFPLLPADVIDASVTVSMQEGTRVRTAEVRFEPGERKTKAVSLPALADEPPPVRVDVLVIRGDGSSFAGAPVQTLDPVFIVRDRDGEHRQLRVRLVAGPTLATHGLLAVALQLLGDDDTVADEIVFTQSQREPSVLLVPVAADGTATARYRVVRYGTDGVARPGAIESTSAGELLVPAVASA